MQASMAEARVLQERGTEEDTAKAHRHLTSSVFFAFKMHQFTQGFDGDCAASFAELNEMMSAIDLPVDPSAFDL